jgi:hypothetical protein
MKSTLALFARANSHNPMALTDWADGYGDYVRLTEYTEVDFIDLPKETLVPQQIAVIDRVIAEITRDFAARLESLKSRKTELLSIGFESVTQPESNHANV